MRKAFYYDSAIPPEDWLKITSLLWDKIWVSPLVSNLLTANTFEELKGHFLTRLYQADKDIFDTEDPKIGQSKAQEVLDADGIALYKKIALEYIDEFNKKDLDPKAKEANERIIKQARFEISRGNLTKAKQLMHQMEERQKVYRKNLIEKAEYYNRA